MWKVRNLAGNLWNWKKFRLSTLLFVKWSSLKHQIFSILPGSPDFFNGSDIKFTNLHRFWRGQHLEFFHSFEVFGNFWLWNSWSAWLLITSGSQQGLVSSPVAGRRSRDVQLFFVNGRPIDPPKRIAKLINDAFLISRLLFVTGNRDAVIPWWFACFI